MHTSGAPSTEIALPSAGNNICFWALEQVPSVWQQWWAGVQHGRQQEGKKKRKKKNCFRSLHLYYVYWIWFKRSWHQRFAQKFIMWEARAYFIVRPGKGLAETTLNWEGFFFLSSFHLWKSRCLMVYTQQPQKKKSSWNLSDCSFLCGHLLVPWEGPLALLVNGTLEVNFCDAAECSSPQFIPTSA